MVKYPISSSSWNVERENSFNQKDWAYINVEIEWEWMKGKIYLRPWMFYCDMLHWVGRKMKDKELKS